MRKLIFILFLNPFISFSQQLFLPLNHSLNISYQKDINKKKNSVHTGFKPLLSSELNSFSNTDSLNFLSERDSIILNWLTYKWFWKKLRTEDFINIHNKGFSLQINPLFNLEKGKLKNSDSSYTMNTRGIELKADFGQKISIYSSFYENQAFFIPYVDQYVKAHLVAPGQGSVKIFKKNGHDFSMSSSYVSFVPNSNLIIQFGQDKSFVGEGYRSLLLSDNSYNYPFLKMIFKTDKFQWVSMYTELQDFKQKYYYYHTRKHATFSYLSYKPTAWSEIGLFEGIIWRTSDDSSYVRDFKPEFFIPIPVVRTLKKNFFDKNNAVLGLNAKTSLTNFMQLYAQFAINPKSGDYKTNYGYQLGIKCFDVLLNRFAKARFYLQYEFNFAQPYMYAHTINNMGYEHYNQPLAHPLGAGFKENILLANFKVFDFIASFNYISIQTSTNISNQNFGNDIFQPLPSITQNLTYVIGQGNKTTIKYKVFSLSYLMNPRTNLQFFVSYLIRDYSSDFSTFQTNFLTFGLKSAINNYYYDF